jgi:hypothetical protein
MDYFWYISVSEQFDEAIADRINGKVWGKIPTKAARDLLKRFNIQELGLDGFVKALRYWPWHILGGYQESKTSMAPLLLYPPAPPRKPGSNGDKKYAGKEMHRGEFESFARAIDSRIQGECLSALPDPPSGTHVLRVEIFWVGGEGREPIRSVSPA